jgi:chromate transporter
LSVSHLRLSDEELNSALAISQASPGPLGLYIVVVGYFVAGLSGALAAALALASPAILAIPVRTELPSVGCRYDLTQSRQPESE